MREQLEVCWYLSPPWSDRVPPLFFQIKERVYIPKFKAIGWVCGAHWEHAEYNWRYTIACADDYLIVSECDLKKTGRMHIEKMPQPAHRLGDKVFVSSLLDRRIILGMFFNSDKKRWTYAVERTIPDVKPQTGDRMNWYLEEDITPVEVRS